MMLPKDPAEAFQGQLGDDHLLWTGTPANNLRFASTDWLLIPFSAMWGGFAIFWNWNAWHMNAPFFFKLFGLPFLGIGLYIIAGRFFFDAWRRGHTIYGLTERRALIASFVRGKRVESFPLSQLGSTTLVEHADGRGSIIFAQDRSNPFQSGRGVRQDKGFLFIENAQTVADILRSAQSKL
jgi:hypothetical protein